MASKPKTPPLIDRVIENDPIQRAVLIDEIATCRKRMRVTVTELRNAPAKAHQEQHGYYRSTVQPILRRFLNETQGGVPDPTRREGFRDFTEQEAHDWIKEDFAREGLIGWIPYIDPRTGEQQGNRVPSCGDMNAVQMYDFTDLVVSHLTRHGWPVPKPNKRWKEDRERARREAMEQQAA